METSTARLEVVAGKAVGTSISVEDELLIGRHATGPGQLAHDEEISRSHARVTLDANGALAIEDLGSTNGTFVNGLRVHAPHTLSEGDTIEIGGSTLIVREVPGPRSGSPAEPKGGIAAPSDATYVSKGAPHVAASAMPGVEDATSQAPAVAHGNDDAGATDAGYAGEHAPPATPPLSLQLEVDFVAREARLFINGAASPVRLVLDAGVWTTAPFESTEERRGPPA